MPMRQILNDFMMSQLRPDGTVRIPLGSESRSSQLAGLSGGERILIVYPGNLSAEAVAASTVSDGERWWYGVVASADAIRNLDTDGPIEQAEQPTGRNSQSAKPRVG